jgi:hypothetical protein
MRSFKSIALAAAFATASLGVNAEVTMEKITFNGWENCIKLSNGTVELIATTAVGPRIMRYGFVGGQNFFWETPEDQGKTGGDTWRMYGGHRLWHAPEDIVRTYWPDNEPIESKWDGKTLSLLQPVEGSTGVQKSIHITLAPSGTQVKAVHRTVNTNLWDIELAPWVLTVMNKGGRMVVPQEEYRPHPDYLVPARPLVLWHFTNMADPRWTWGEKYIQLRQEPGNTDKEKVGLAVSMGWAAYTLNGEVFVKHFPHDPKATYTDLGCNFETFTNESMLEIETLGPLTKMAPGAVLDHVEHWNLFKADVGNTDAEIDEVLLPLVESTKVK